MGQPKRQKRGEETRNRILDGAIKALAKYGFAGVTHRKIADESDNIRLALTTYYFKSLDDLVLAAAERFTHQQYAIHEIAWQTADDLLNRAKAEGWSKDQTVAEMASLCVQYIEDMTAGSSIAIKMEVGILYGSHTNKSLANLAVEYRRRLQDYMIRLARKLGSPEPDVDGQLFIGLILKLEFESLTPEMKLDELAMKRQLRRQLRLMTSTA